jgi:hypothetical protein
LLLIKPFLADQALIIVDDCNWSTVQQANWDFMAANPECQVLLEFQTPVARYPTFWNGIHVFSWDVNRRYNYSCSTFRKRRQEIVVKAIYNLQQLEQQRDSLDISKI